MKSGVMKGVELDFGSQCAFFRRSRLKDSASRPGGDSSQLIPKSQEELTDEDMAEHLKLVDQCVKCRYILYLVLKVKADAGATRG